MLFATPLRPVRPFHYAQVRLLNGSAVCNMRMGRWEEAESQLMEAFEKDAKNPDTLANLATASLHLGKPASRFVGYGCIASPTCRTSQTAAYLHFSKCDYVAGALQAAQNRCASACCCLEDISC